MTNIEKIRQELPQYKCGAMLVISPINRLYATGFTSSAGALLVTANGAWFFTDSRYIEAAGKTISGATVLKANNEKPYAAQIKAILDEQSVTAVGFEDETMSYSKYLEWKEKLEREPVPAQKLLTDLRIIKSPADLVKMKAAQRLAEKSFMEILPLISTDITEKQLAAELLYRFLQNGGDDKAFDPIVVSAPRSSMPHGVPGSDKITKGFLTIDFGVRLDGWCSDTTRTVCLGKPDDEMIKVYETVLKAQEAGISAARAGVKGSDVDGAARKVIENAGYGEFFEHGFGHGLGLEVHEAPTASAISEDILQAGAVISAEPGIYLPGRYGVRIEDVIYITEDGCENITALPKTLMVI